VNEQTPPKPTSLADRALMRLRKIATGNGLEPAAIVALETQENLFTLSGVMDVSPLCETVPIAYPGGVRGRDRKVAAHLAALQEAVTNHKKEFRENPDWVHEVTAEIKAHESQGWGLENAKVTLPKMSAVYAATETCPSCNGRKLLTCAQCQGSGQVICTQCQGQGREPCYHCGGRGENPQQPGQRCTTCNGTRFAPCRFCQTRGYLPCPTCNGKRGTPCTACQGQGKLTQEVTVTCGAETHFRMISEGLPSGLRRGLDRIGTANLGKGHADITTLPPPKDTTATPQEKKAQFPILTYQVILPYAEMRVGFGNKKGIISVVGKRCAISGVPAFIDDTIKPWRDKLHQAALANAPLEEALEVRAIKEILALTVSGNGRSDEVRRLYPFGLSTEAITSILTDTKLALNVATLKTRSIIAASCSVICVIAFYALFMTDAHESFTLGWQSITVAGTDIAILALALGLSWAVLNFSTRFVLQRRFPQLSVALQQKIGKTGASMLGGITAGYLLFILLSSIKPLWLVSLFH
jgi:hypothetical protein